MYPLLNFKHHKKNQTSMVLSPRGDVLGGEGATPIGETYLPFSRGNRNLQGKGFSKKGHALDGGSDAGIWTLGRTYLTEKVKQDEAGVVGTCWNTNVDGNQKTS